MARNIQDLIQSGVVSAPSKQLTMEQKEALAEAGTAFTVTDIRLGSDPKNGEYWSVQATIDGEPVQFNIGSHPRRDAFMQAVSINCAEGPIDGLRLVGYPGQQGRKFVSMEPAEQ